MDEDNNPFAGGSHVFGSGLSGLDESLRSGFQDHFQDFQPFRQEVPDIHSQQVQAIEEDTAHRTFTEEYSEPYIDSSINEQYIHTPPRDSEPPIYTAETTISNGTVLYTVHYTDPEQGRPSETRRRYSEFASLRLALCRLLPTVIVPPLPHKHTFAEYLLNPFNAKTDPQTISSRKRLLTTFLQRCYMIPQINQSPVWHSFLNPVVTWSQVLITPPVSLLPASNLLAPPLDPVKPSPLHLLLPLPRSNHTSTHIDNRFHEYQQKLINYKAITSGMGKTVKRAHRHFNGLVKDLGQLGALYNAFSLENETHNSHNSNDGLSLAIEKTGQAIDIDYLNSEALAFKLLVELQEPIVEIKESCKISIEKVLNFHKLKTLQLSIIQSTVKIREDRIRALQNLQHQADRLEEVLSKSTANIQNPQINTTMENLHKGESLGKVSSPWLKLFHSGNNKSNDISKLNAYQRSEEIAKIEGELVKLNDCSKIVTKDIEQINEAVQENLDELILYFQKKWDGMIRNYIKSLMIYLRENLKSWEEAKMAIDEI